jgi:hypothetical protein
MPFGHRSELFPRLPKSPFDLPLVLQTPIVGGIVTGLQFEVQKTSQRKSIQTRREPEHAVFERGRIQRLGANWISMQEIATRFI